MKEITRKYWLATIDDSNPVPEEVGLVHEVGGQDYGAPCLVLDQQLPDGAPWVGVHPSRWLIQHNNPDID